MSKTCCPALSVHDFLTVQLDISGFRGNNRASSRDFFTRNPRATVFTEFVADMLVSFSVSNFRSFGEEVTLNMVASNRLTDHLNHRVPIGDTGQHLLRSAVLYGANASGKSNLIKAMEFAQRLITLPPHDRHPGVDFFRFRPSPGREPSSFEFRFLLGSHIFAYGFDVLAHTILAEWLTVSKTADDERVVFERDAKGKVVAGPVATKELSGDAALSAILTTLAKLSVRPNQLFLNLLSSFPEEILGETLASVIRWLTKDLVILNPNPRACDLLERLDRDERFRQFATQFLDRVDTGIGELDFERTKRECREYERDLIPSTDRDRESPYSDFGCAGDTDEVIDPEDPTKVIVRRLLARHAVQQTRYPLPFSEESDGTQQLLHYLPVLFTPHDRSMVVVIDELDRSLHPLLCEELIRFFSENCEGATKQLIVTTHEVQLLSQDLLRRDEYWFVEKDKTQQSRLTSLCEFNIRNDLQVRKGYLQGRFGAVPVLGNTDELNRLINCDPGEDSNAAKKTNP